MAELYTKLKDLEENPKTKNKAAQVIRYECGGFKEINQFQEEIAKLQKELEKWKKKAERTPTVQLLQNQIENMKVGVIFVETLPILEAIVSARLRKIINLNFSWTTIKCCRKCRAKAK